MNKQKPKSLLKKKMRLSLMQIFVIFGLLPMLTTTLFAQGYYIDRIKNLEWDSKQTEIEENLEKCCNAIDDFLNSISKISQNVALDNDVIEQNEEIFPSWFEKILETYPEIYDIYVAYAQNGNMTMTFRNNSKFNTMNYPKSAYQNDTQRWYDFSVIKEEFVIKEAHFDEDFMKIWLISILSPIYNSSGDFLGIVGTDIALEQFANIIPQISESDGRSVIMAENFNFSHRIVYTNSGKYLGWELNRYLNYSGITSFENLEISIINEKDGFIGFFYDNHTNSMNYYFKKKIVNQFLNWTLIISISEMEINQEITPFFLLTIAITIASILLITTMFLLLARGFTRSIRIMLKQTNQVRQGIYQKIPTESRISEFLALKRNFNMMVTSIQEQVDKFRVLADLSPYSIAGVELPQKITYINKAFEQVFGYTLEDIATVDDWIEKSFNTDKKREQIRSHWDWVINNMEKAKEKPKKFEVITKSGKKLEILAYILEVTQNTTFFVYENITAKKQQEKIQLNAQKLESLAIIAGGIAHDFNNILMALLGNINLLQMEEDLSPFMKETLMTLEKSVVRARGISNQLLTFSKGGDPVMKPCNLVEIAKDAVDFTTHGSRCVVNLNIDSNIPMMFVDEAQISQVIQNLLINSQQAMPNGGQINLNLTKVRFPAKNEFSLAEGEYVKIEVIDSGVGIPPEFMDKIFTPYFTSKPKGNGLGLATCYSIIKKHKGYIGFNSKLNQGSTFFFYLPIFHYGKATESEIDEKEEFPSCKILILEDEENIRQTLSKILTKWGSEVISATDGEEALRIFREEFERKVPFEIVILDLTIPGGLGGKEVIKKMRELDPEISAIVSSGYSNERIMSNFSEYGFNGVLKKPFTLKELSKSLKTVYQTKKK